MNNRPGVSFKFPHRFEILKINHYHPHWDSRVKGHLVRNSSRPKDDGRHIAEHNRTNEKDRVALA